MYCKIVNKLLGGATEISKVDGLKRVKMDSLKTDVITGDKTIVKGKTNVLYNGGIVICLDVTNKEHEDIANKFTFNDTMIMVIEIDETNTVNII